MAHKLKVKTKQLLHPSTLCCSRSRSRSRSSSRSSHRSVEDMETIDVPEGLDEAELSEEQLRQIYDDEEIDRFLHLFSTYVTEVRRPDEAGPSNLRFTDGTHSRNPSENEEMHARPDGAQVEEEAEATLPGRSLSERIAFNYVAPMLPTETMDIPPFTYGRLRLTAQRLYLSAQPAYGPFFAKLIRLAIWEDWWVSFKYCLIYWSLWLNNLLLPALAFRVLYSLMRRRIFSYPTLPELRKHRKEVSQAAEFGDEVQARLSATSFFHVKELWRLFIIWNKARGKAKRLAKMDGGEVRDRKIEDAPPDDDVDEEEEGDYKRAIMQAMGIVADIHEQVRNIFIWRRPITSRLYATGLTIVFLVVLLLPAQVLAKLFYFGIGFMFWHVAPVIASLSPADRARIPLPFSDAPTDADYAMELISKRIAAGLPIKPKSRKERREYYLGASASSTDLPTTLMRGMGDSVSEDAFVDWKKWGERAAFGKSLAHEGKRLLSKDKDGKWPPKSPLVPQIVVNFAQPDVSIETHSYPAQHNAALGLLTLNPYILEFTPLFSSDPTVVIKLCDIRGVTKCGVLGGLSIRFNSPESEKGVKEKRFRWVGSRDDLFARLVAVDGGSWKKSL